MVAIEAVGALAALITTAEVVPQVFKTLTTRSARDLSWGALSMLMIGLSLWVVYGVFVGDMWIFLSAAFSLGLYVFLSVLKTSFETKNKES
jgi:MtN3 and saliva related transmembrane protein